MSLNIRDKFEKWTYENDVDFLYDEWFEYFESQESDYRIEHFNQYVSNAFSLMELNEKYEEDWNIMKLITRYESIKNQEFEYFEIFSDNIELLDKNDIALDMLNYQLDYDNPNHREMFLKNKEIYEKSELDIQFNEFLEYDYDDEIKQSIDLNQWNFILDNEDKFELDYLIKENDDGVSIMSENEIKQSLIEFLNNRGIDSLKEYSTSNEVEKMMRSLNKEVFDNQLTLYQTNSYKQQ